MGGGKQVCFATFKNTVRDITVGSALPFKYTPSVLLLRTEKVKETRMDKVKWKIKKQEQTFTLQTKLGKGDLQHKKNKEKKKYTKKVT